MTGFTPCQPEPRRCSWRLHRSTLLIAVAVAVVLALTNLPGRVTRLPIPEEYRTSNKTMMRHEHGWPWIFGLSESIDVVSIFSNAGATPAVAKAIEEQPWNWTLTFPYWSAVAACGDLAFAIFLIVGIGALWEWRRRRRNTIWQVRLSDLFAVTFALALACGWWMSWHNQSVRQQQAIDCLCPAGSIQLARNVYAGPRWLSHWAGRRFEQQFSVYYSLDLATGRRVEPHELERQLVSIAELDSLTHLRLAGYRFDDRWAAAVAKLPRLEELDLYQTALTDEGLRELVRLPNLKQLRITMYRSRITPAGIAQFRESRPNVEVRY